MEQDNLDALSIQFEKYKGNKVVRNSFYGVIQFVIPALLLLGFTPVFIHKMGTEHYGLWMLATSALGLMGIAEFGLNTAISKFVAEYVEGRNTDALSAVVSAGLVAYILLGFFLIVPLYVFSPALAGIFKPSQAVSVEQIGLVIRTMSLGFIPLLLRSGAMAIPIGLQRFQVPVIVTVGYQLLSYTAALMIVFLRGSVAQVVESTVAVLWVTALGSLFVAWRMLEPFNLKFTLTSSKEVLFKMFSFALISGISGLGSQIFSFADRLAVGVVLGLEAVAYYTVIISVAAKILQLSSALTSALMPAVSSWMASGEIRRVRAYFLRATTALLVLNFLVASVLLLLSGTLLRLWMGEAFANHVLVPFRILIVIYALISLNTPAFFVAYGLGNPGINALASMVGGCLTIGLILIWGKMLGLLGTVLANGGYLITLAITGYVYLRINWIIKQTSVTTKSQEVNSVSHRLP
jgi:O-antigen/teichoic acid export membrane protein